MAAERLKIGVSACFFHADPVRPIFTGKTLQYVEQSVVHWVMSTRALAVMIPSPAGETQARAHRDAALYDQLFHEVEILPGSDLAAVLGGQTHAKVNSVHHQAIKTLAPGFVVEARSPDDGVIEAIRRPGGSYLAAVQWHPEFHRSEPGTLDDRPILSDFLSAVQAARKR